VVVWILVSREREVVVITRGGESRVRMGERIAEHESLPGLAPLVADLFRQISI